MNCTIGYHSDYNGDGWYFYPPKDYSKLETKTRKRCCSCNAQIDIGSIVLKFERAREPLSDIEENIYGDEVFLAPYYFCEKCSDIYFNLEDLGYKVALMDMREALLEYKDLHRFIKESK